MSSEILSVLEYMEKEKGIGRNDMIAAIVNAIKTAALKGVNSGQELKIEINPKNGQVLALVSSPGFNNDLFAPGIGQADSGI